MTQRVLWASTSTKNPKMRDVLYVEELIGPDTVNTIPPATLDAFRDHGEVRASLESEIEEAQQVMADLAAAGISIDKITGDLVTQGVKLFAEPFDKLLNAVDPKCKLPLSPVNPMTYLRRSDAAAGHRTSGASPVKPAACGRATRPCGPARTKTNGSDGLAITEDQLAQRAQFEQIAARREGGRIFRHAAARHGRIEPVPRSAAPLLRRSAGIPELHVLDSTDPAQIRAIEKQIDVKNTLFIVSSKSGSTLEPNIFKQYFFERAGRDGSRFYRHHRSRLENAAGGRGRSIPPHFLRRAVHRRPLFGALGFRHGSGARPWASTRRNSWTRPIPWRWPAPTACPSRKIPAFCWAFCSERWRKAGRDKVTIVASPGILDLGAWLEQLIAESTGKNGKGLIPVDRETLGPPAVYGNDRVFVYERLESRRTPTQDQAMDALAAAGHPVIRIAVERRLRLGRGIFPLGNCHGGRRFDHWHRSLQSAGRRSQQDRDQQTDRRIRENRLAAGGIARVRRRRHQGLRRRNRRTDAGRCALRAHLEFDQGRRLFRAAGLCRDERRASRRVAGDAHRVRDAKRVATCLGFGPRFLHSTGQAYKGGPNTGVFLQITADDAQDLAVPGQKYTFGIVKAAQARGDLAVLLRTRPPRAADSSWAGR